MKPKDWTGERIPVLARCFNPKQGLSVEFRIRAGTEDEAKTKADTIVRRSHNNFFERTHGNYNTRFAHLVNER